MNSPLIVWYNNTLVGRIIPDEQLRMTFTYDTNWLSIGFQISQRLPLQLEKFDASIAHTFFANLLPEAGAREHIVRDLKISNDDVGLLSAIGGECAGALTILPEDTSPQSVTGYEEISEETLKQMLARRGIVFKQTTDSRPRLSLAGAQDKCPVLWQNGKLSLPKGDSPSSHIIKFDIPGYSHIPAYEYVLTKLAGSIGLPVVNCSFNRLDEYTYLLVERYDRLNTETQSITRLHQEDFCQALGISHARKYEQEGGPSFSDCYHLCRLASQNAFQDSENLLKWQLFNFLAGNSDGHAKNLSFLYGDQHQCTLAPFYDLVCTRAVDRIDVNLAMGVGGIHTPGNIKREQWHQLAASCQVKSSLIDKLITELAISLSNNIVTVITEFEEEYEPYPALDRVKQVVQKQCKRVLK